MLHKTQPPTHHNRFTALFLGLPGWASARRELLDFMVQGKISRGRHTDYPAGRHSIRTNQCPPPPSPHKTQMQQYKIQRWLDIKDKAPLTDAQKNKF